MRVSLRRAHCAAALVLWFAFGSVSARPVHAGDAAVPVPTGSRAREHHVYESSRGFRPTVRFYQRHFDKRGAAYELRPIYAYRGVTIARFLARDAHAPWRAVHVFHHQGRTFIRVVPGDPQTSARPS